LTSLTSDIWQPEQRHGHQLLDCPACAARRLRGARL